MQTFKEFYDFSKLANKDSNFESKHSSKLDKLQIALDVAGLEPTQTLGAIPDGANAVISLLRAAASKEPDVRKKHLINAGISAVGVIPFGDVIKILKVKGAAKPVLKTAIKGARLAKNYAKMQRQQRVSQVPASAPATSAVAQTAVA